MKKWLKWLTLGPLLLLLATLGVVQALRLVAVDDGHRTALALLEAKPAPLSGSNGFAALLLADYEVPLDGVDAAMTAEVAHFDRWLQGSGGELLSSSRDAGAGEAGPIDHLPGERWPMRAPLDSGALLCSLGDAGCLAKVRAAPDAARALLQREAARLANVDLALAAQHFRSPYPSAHEEPLPAYQNLRLALVRAALDAVEGRVQESMARSCRLLSASRRFAPEATNLIGIMVFGASAEGAANLLMQTRREHPGTALPAECNGALVSVRTEDYLICEGMRGEFRWSRSVSQRMDRALDDWRPEHIGSRLLFVDGRLMDAWVAPRFAEPCSESYRRQVFAGKVPASIAKSIKFGDPSCYGAYISCILAQIGTMDYAKYQQRQLDHAAKLRLALASMAVVDGSLSLETALAQAASPGYALDVDPAAGTISITLRSDPGPGQPRQYTVPY